MRTTEALAHLLQLERPVVTTGEVAARLQIKKYEATWLMGRLARDGIALKIKRGLWLLTPKIDPYALPQYLTAPYPSYLSIWTALYHHGMIDQIPRDIYVVSLDRSKRIKTTVATFVVQHISPKLFGGFDTRDGIRMASPEKALFDTLYFGALRGWRSLKLPEVEISGSFDHAEVSRWIARLHSRRVKTIMNRKLTEMLPDPERADEREGS